MLDLDLCSRVYMQPSFSPSKGFKFMTLITQTSTSFIHQPVHVEVALQHHPVLQAGTLMLLLSLLSSTAISQPDRYRLEYGILASV